MRSDRQLLDLAHVAHRHPAAAAISDRTSSLSASVNFDEPLFCPPVRWFDCAFSFSKGSSSSARSTRVKSFRPLERRCLWSSQRRASASVSSYSIQGRVTRPVVELAPTGHTPSRIVRSRVITSGS